MKSINLNEVFPEITAHLSGQKYVFLRDSETLSNLTQAAYGIITNEDNIESHQHGSMDEFYYFLEGNGVFLVGDQKLVVIPNTFVFVPSGIEHKLTTTNKIKFFYFGIAV